MTGIRMLLVMLAAAASIATADDPPPFGTVLGQWDLPMSGSFTGAGITWRPDSGLLYLMDQDRCAWKLDPADPTGTITRDSWVFVNLGSVARDIPFGVAWDRDSGCFWISQVLDQSIYAGCYLLRMAWSDSAWRWRGTPADSWRIDSTFGLNWIAGMDKSEDLGYFVGAGLGDLDWFCKFDPYSKSLLGVVYHGSDTRGVSLIPADSFYLIGGACGDSFCPAEWDSTGRLLRAGPAWGAADVEVLVPEQPPAPDDPVICYGIRSSRDNTLQRISAGLLWGQLEAGQAIAEPAPPTARPAGFSIEPNPCRGSATIRLASTLTVPCSIELADVAGRVVLCRGIAGGRSGAALDLRHLNAGVYVLRLDAGTFNCSEKMILQH
jgi:hypothetical protein